MIESRFRIFWTRRDRKLRNMKSIVACCLSEAARAFKLMAVHLACMV